jgi:hypothetical protein
MKIVVYSTSDKSRSVPQKDRNLSIFDYFEQLQIEYVLAELRKKIYPSEKDKAYYTRLMEQKEIKIKDISIRNSLPSLFDSEKVKTAKYKVVYGNGGLPNFHYSNPTIEQQFKEKDVRFYYAKGGAVKVVKGDNEDFLVGIIESVDLEKGTARVLIKGKTTPVFLEDITRLL